jgi:hypothetical protein
MKKQVLGLFIAWWMTLTFGVASAQAVSLTVEPSSFPIVPGEMVDVDAIISGLGQPPSVGAFDLFMGFNPALVTATGVSFGPYLGDPLLGQALTATTFSPMEVEFAEVSLLAPADLDALQSPSFALATLSFTGVGSGLAAFAFSSGVVDDAFGAKLVVVATPEPDTWLLLATSLAGLLGYGFWHRQRTVYTNRTTHVHPGPTAR